MNWSDEANSIVEELLRDLPAPVRDGVVDSAHTHAESLTSEAGEDEVSLETAVRAFIESTPSDLRSRLKHALTYHGIDPEEYEDAFGAS
ncbi:MAG TPA: DUF2621 family protein [Terriglobales bacterium]|nr:DUF2621 family protein [Terriglobales bacterium]